MEVVETDQSNNGNIESINASGIQNSVMQFNDETPMRGNQTVNQFNDASDNKDLDIKAKISLNDANNYKSLSMKNIHDQ
jgi:hypothetical protein